MKLPTLATVVLCVMGLMAVAAENLTTFTAMYELFDSSNTDIFQFEGTSGLYKNTLQMGECDSGNETAPAFNEPPPSPRVFKCPSLSNSLNGAFQYSAGRVMLKQAFKLWKQDYNKTSDRVASFNSSFLFSIYPAFGDPLGEGLAFIIVPNMSLPSNSSGQYLGLTNNHTNGHPRNQFVAIEFDNFKQDFDPDANHVGLDINSIISNVTVSLTPLGIQIAPLSNETSFYNVWVQYDGVKKIMEVYIAQPTIQWINSSDFTIRTINVSQPDTPVLKSNLDLGGVLNQYSYFGFSGSTGSATQLNLILRWNLTVESYQDNLEVSPALAPAHDDDDDDEQSRWTIFFVVIWISLFLMWVDEMKR